MAPSPPSFQLGSGANPETVAEFRGLAVQSPLPLPPSPVSAAWSWHSGHEEKAGMCRERVVLAGPSTPKAELNTSTRKWGFGLVGWENPGRQCLFIREAESNWNLSL